MNASTVTLSKYAVPWWPTGWTDCPWPAKPHGLAHRSLVPGGPDFNRHSRHLIRWPSVGPRGPRACFSNPVRPLVRDSAPCPSARHMTARMPTPSKTVRLNVLQVELLAYPTPSICRRCGPSWREKHGRPPHGGRFRDVHKMDKSVPLHEYLLGCLCLRLRWNECVPVPCQSESAS
jgi:hypothetical protein